MLVNMIHVMLQLVLLVCYHEVPADVHLLHCYTQDWATRTVQKATAREQAIYFVVLTL